MDNIFFKVTYSNGKTGPTGIMNTAHILLKHHVLCQLLAMARSVSLTFDQVNQLETKLIMIMLGMYIGYMVRQN